jgi:hypothetical protein
MVCRLATTWMSVSQKRGLSRDCREMPSGNSTESANSIKYNFSGSGVEIPFLEEFLVPFVLGGDASTQEITSESMVRRYESRWQAKSPTTRLLSFGGSKGML